jgi:uncharacterized membrane protein YraQ (UPF0718 family)
MLKTIATILCYPLLWLSTVITLDQITGNRMAAWCGGIAVLCAVILITNNKR